MPHTQSSPVNIIILGDGSLFDEGISNILSFHPQLNVTRVLYTNDDALYNLVGFEDPHVVFITEFDALDVERVVKFIFSIPSNFVRCIVVVRDGNNRLDVYARPAAPVSVTRYSRKSVAVKTKEEFINLARCASINA